MDRGYILDTALRLVLQDREDSYGDPNIQMQTTWDLWVAYQYGVLQSRIKTDPGSIHGSGHEAAMFLVLNKISRIACGRFGEDNYIDAAGYLAIAAEIMDRLKNKESKK